MNEWTNRFKTDEATSVAELVNLVLRCAGCSIGVDVHDIGDPDNAIGRLTAIQEEYQAVSRTSMLFVARVLLTLPTAKCSRLSSDC